MSATNPFQQLDQKYSGFYRGEVKDNNDPLKRGRCKVEIYPMFKGITTADLPWSIPAYPIFEGAGSGVGYFAVPKIGTFVYCVFEEGDPNSPIMLFEAPDGVHGVPSSSAINYPNRKVLRTTSGIEIYIDDTSKDVKISTPYSNILIDGSGNITVSATGNIVMSGTSISLNP